MILIDTIELRKNKNHAEMQTKYEFKGDAKIIKEEIKVFVKACVQDDELIDIFIFAIEEALHDN